MFNRHKKRVKSVNLTDFYSEELKNNAEKVLKQRISSLKAESGKENSSELSEAEIMKALEICTTKGASCSNCPAFVKVDKSRCKEVLAGALDLLNRKNVEIEKPWETFNIDFTNPCYLCKHPLEMPNRKKNFKCNSEECEWLKVWSALRKALYEIDIKNAEIERVEKSRAEWKEAALRKAKELDKSQNELSNLKFDLMCGTSKSQAEVIQLFVRRLKARSRKMQSSDWSGEFWDKAVLVTDIEKTAKEMGVEL